MIEPSVFKNLVRCGIFIGAIFSHCLALKLRWMAQIFFVEKNSFRSFTFDALKESDASASGFNFGFPGSWGSWANWWVIIFRMTQEREVGLVKIK